jgi:hypothetical protein
VANLEAGLSVRASDRLEYRASRWSQSDLDEAAESLVARWTGAIGFVAVGSDLVGHSLAITVHSDSYAMAMEDLKLSPPKVPYHVEIGDIEHDQVCTSRTNGFSPMQAGTVIRKGNGTTGPACTMGFSRSRGNG